MRVIHADVPIRWDCSPSLFLAGPAPRQPGVPSWRPRALAILEGLGFAGMVLVPERSDWQARFDYKDQIEWEFAGLEGASVIAFWVPRDLATLPGFTTNVEVGRYVGSGRVVYGRPDDAPKNRYLDWLYRRCTGLTPCRTLEETLQAVVVRTAATGA